MPPPLPVPSRRPGASLPPSRGDSLSGRRRLRPLPLLLLLPLLPPPPPPLRLLALSAPRNRPPRVALRTCSSARRAGSGGPGRHLLISPWPQPCPCHS
ncbi:beta-catenin-interacting protein 1 isoform X2 [Tamandua tetradactyla]|uniref:beta-catenin-interacting protein 1 isoform X2 n=1 Tax=Tamandua tetradactyla TaxID=48850 RepID=UPI00405494E2